MCSWLTNTLELHEWNLMNSLKQNMFKPLQPTKLMTQKDVLQRVGMTSTEASYSLPTAVFPSSPSPKGLLLVAVTTNILVLKCDSYGG